MSAGGKGYPAAGRAALQPLLGLQHFHHADFQVEMLMDDLAEELLQPPAQPSAPGAVAQTGSRHAPRDAISLCRPLLERFERAERDLIRLESSVSAKVDGAQADVAARHRAFEEQVAGLEAGFEALQARFLELDNQMASAAQVATRIGDRLQTAEVFRERATEAIDMIQYLQQFSRTVDFRDLADLFGEAEDLDRAAAMTGRMQALAQELATAKERAGLASNLPSAAAAQQPGTIEYAAAKLEDFRQQLELKVVSRFDVAAGKGDYAAMSQCARIMSHFPRGSETLINRYIASRPMFMDVREVLGPAQEDGAAEPAGAALQRLNALHKSVSAAVVKEAASMERIFPSPAAALAAFVTRIFEQRLKVALEGLLMVPGPGEPPEALQQYLQLLAEAYRRTHALAAKLQPIAGSDCNTAELADVVFAEPLEEYTDLELAWLQRLYETRAPAAQGTLSLQLVTDMFVWNREAVERSGVVCPEGDRPAAVRALFHSSTVDRASTGCLLEQVATHVIAAIADAVEQARRAAAKPFQPAADMRGPALLNKAAYPVAVEGIGKILAAVNIAASIIRLLMQHYSTVVEPAVEVSPPEAASCATGLAALTRAVEDRVTAALAASLSYLASQVDRTLVAEQRRSDFLPKAEGGPALELERPTDAALLATALLRAAARVATANLHGANLASFLTQLGRQVHSVLMGHMQRYVYSATGALRWKRDVTEYADWARALRAPLLDDRFQELQALGNVLVVAPTALLGLVDGSLRISHSAALKFIRLREDFKSARLPGGISLAQTFAED